MRFARVYDITTSLGTESIDYPGDTPYVRELLCTIHGGGRFDLARLEMSAHSGTHLDAPAHFISGGKTIDQYAVQDFILPAHVIPIEDKEAVRPSELAGLGVRPGDALLFRTDNSISGRCRTGAFSESFVYLSLEAAALCVDMRLGLVGLDYISVDRYGDDGYPVHRKLSGNGTLILEGIDLTHVPVGKYTLFCFPLKIAGGEASPVRAVLFEEVKGI